MNAHGKAEAVGRWLGEHRPLLIDGEWRAAEDGDAIEVMDPATAERIATVAGAGAIDVDRAVQSAQAAFVGSWRTTTPSERARLLWSIAELIDRHTDELALLETLDNGMPLSIAGAAAVPMAAEMFRYFAGWCTKIEGSTATPSLPGDFHAYTRREPIGVVALIVPWNFPLLMACAKIAPALAAGCTCVLKPAEQTPLTALRLGELLLEAGVPPGVVNIVPGLGGVAGQALVAHPGISKIAFTGSTAVGKAIVRQAAERLPRLTLELGGKSPTIILADADIDAAVPGAAMSIFFNSGQVCVAGSRLFVARGIFDRVMEGVAAFAQGMAVGSGLDPASQMGPLVSAAQRDRVAGFIESGLREGATMLAGGAATGPGYFVRPTIVTGTDPGMAIARAEIFGPVLIAEPFDDLDEVVRQSNDTDYGLAASVWTRDLSQAHMLSARLQAGLIGVNCAGVSDVSMPFGGYRQSGWGRELGREGMDAYLQTKSVFVRL